MSRIIQISELSFATRDKRLILENLFLSVERGEVVAITGPPNAGKTLLLELIQGAVRPKSGQILVNDRNVTRLGRRKLYQLRQYLGVVPQRPVWPHQLNLEDALRFKLNWLRLPLRQSERKVDEAINLLGLSSLRGRGFLDLSPLEQRTAYLALALCHDPVLLLLDDPFFELGEDGTATLSVLLNQIRQQRNLTTLLTGQHAEPLKRMSHRMIELQGGALVEAQ